MERKEEYRHFVEPAVKKLFIESLKYSLKEIDKSKFGFIGIVGSIKDEKESHDIDVIIFPNSDSKIGETIIEISKLYKEAEKYLKKHHERYYIAACPKKAMQELMYYLASLEEGGAGLVPIHSLFFTNYKDFKRLNPKNFEKNIIKNMLVLHGEFNIIKKLKIIPQKKLEPYYFILDFEMTSRIDNFPKHLIRSSAESLFDYLKMKYDIDIKKIPHDVKEINKEFILLIKNLDKKTYINE